jgi:D-beta-D-heptose 7-phosphate kinase / D-beta-D-heptose 1-phosphate adenosyltransferase
MALTGLRSCRLRRQQSAPENQEPIRLRTDDTPIELMTRIRPDILVKGADYRIDQVVGHEFVESYGGRVALVALLPDSSTTLIIERLKADAANALAGLATAPALSSGVNMDG